MGRTKRKSHGKPQAKALAVKASHKKGAGAASKASHKKGAGAASKASHEKGAGAANGGKDKEKAPSGDEDEEEEESPMDGMDKKEAPSGDEDEEEEESPMDGMDKEEAPSGDEDEEEEESPMDGMDKKEVPSGDEDEEEEESPADDLPYDKSFLGPKLNRFWEKKRLKYFLLADVTQKNEVAVWFKKDGDVKAGYFRGMIMYLVDSAKPKFLGKVDEVPAWKASTKMKTAFAVVRFYRTGPVEEDGTKTDQVDVVPAEIFYVHGVAGAVRM